ncbi:hypothetical protein [Thiofilum flexile]|uniref:hypothetical protein n=1 Tax=Thiofilum flexile TaxID=125627 RepID=UPI0003784863|nr:hypothetical protein [Thiofilum flexile]
MSQSIYVLIIGILVLWILYLYEPDPTPSLAYIPAQFDITLHQDCVQAHRVELGETPWSIAQYYVRSGYESRWLPLMYYYSFIDPQDGRIYPGQYLCVHWMNAPFVVWYDDREAIPIWQ